MSALVKNYMTVFFSFFVKFRSRRNTTKILKGQVIEATTTCSSLENQINASHEMKMPKKNPHRTQTLATPVPSSPPATQKISYIIIL